MLVNISTCLVLQCLIHCYDHLKNYCCCVGTNIQPRAHSLEERTEKIIGWSLFDRDPLKSFDFGNVTLLGDAAHPLLPYGSQGATQAPWSKWSKCHVNHAVKQATAHCFGPLALRCRQCRLSLLGNKEQVHWQVNQLILGLSRSLRFTTIAETKLTLCVHEYTCVRQCIFLKKCTGNITCVAA